VEGESLEAAVVARPAIAVPPGAPVRGVALKSALQAASAGLLPASQRAFCQEQASGGTPPEPLPTPNGPSPRGFVPNILVVRGVVPWAALDAGLAALEPVASGRWTVEDICLTSLVVQPEWDGDLGSADEQVALEAGRAVLGRGPALILIAPGFRAGNGGRGRSAAWPRGRVELPADKKKGFHVEDLCWRAIAGLLDAVVEAAAAELPAPSFALLLPEAFSSADGRARLEPFFVARLEALAKLPGVASGAFYQCAWAPHEEAAPPLRLLTDLPFLLEDCHSGLPMLRSRRGAQGGRCPVYVGPLPGSCGCGVVHKRRSSEEVTVAEPLEPGTSLRLTAQLGRFFSWEAAGPSALAGGELAACTLLSGPPCRGPPVSKCLPGAGEAWRPLDIYIGRNNRYGDTSWGNPYKVGRDGDAAQCCRRFADGLRSDEVKLRQLGKLRGRRLRCHCPHGAPCHADSLITIFCEYESEKVMKNGRESSAGDPPPVGNPLALLPTGYSRGEAPGYTTVLSAAGCASPSLRQTSFTRAAAPGYTTESSAASGRSTATGCPLSTQVCRRESAPPPLSPMGYSRGGVPGYTGIFSGGLRVQVAVPNELFSCGGPGLHHGAFSGDEGVCRRGRSISGAGWPM